MLNLKSKQTKSVEVAGEGDTKYRFTFTRFSGTQNQRRVMREEVAKRYASEETGLDFSKLMEINRKAVARQGLERSEVAASEILVSAFLWAKVITGLTMLESCEGENQYYPERIPQDWQTPEGFLGSFDNLEVVHMFSEVVDELNAPISPKRIVDDTEKKRDDVNTQ